MKLKILYVFLLSIILLTSSIFTYGSDSYSPIKLANTPSNIHIEIRPEIELLAGVLSHTSWMERRGPQGTGNEYFRELQNFFANYKEHRAIKIAEKLTRKGFSYDAPPNFILSLGPLPKLKPTNGYSEYLLRRAGGRNHLESFRKELVKLAAESKFIDFYQKHRPFLEEVLKSCVRDFNGTKVITWLQEFSGSQGDEYHLVLAPALFRGGGYAATIDTRDGRKVIYQVIRENGISLKKPEFYETKDLEKLSLHEWGHSFVNPALGKHSPQVKSLIDLYYPVETEMKRIAYGNLSTFFNEQVLRAVVILAIEDLYGKAEAQKHLEIEQATGFYLTEFTLEQLRYYQKNRTKYPTFVDFVPYLLNCYEQKKKDLLQLVPSTTEKLKTIKVLKAYWVCDPNIEAIKAKSPHNILIEVDFKVTTQISKQIDNFIREAGSEFELIAENKTKIEAKVYQGNTYSSNNRTFWGFWLAVDEKDYSMIEPGIPYKLVPKRQNPEYRWVLTEDISLILNKKP